MALRRLDGDGNYRFLDRAAGQSQSAESDRKSIHHPLPNRVCDGRSDQLSGNVRNNGFLWFDTTCFPSPRVRYFGNSGPTVLNGPGQ